MVKLIDLATAYITQHTTGEGKQDWIVYNTDKEKISVLPKELNERQAMSYLHFGRKFELIAFNKGIEFEKNLRPQKIRSLQQMLMNANADKHIMKLENEKLADALDKLTNKQI